MIHVRRHGTEITGSPFKIGVLDCEIGDSTRVTTSGAGLTQATTHKHNDFVISTKEAGKLPKIPEFSLALKSFKTSLQPTVWNNISAKKLST